MTTMNHDKHAPGLTPALVGPEGTVAFQAHTGADGTHHAITWHFDVQGRMTRVEVGTLTPEAYMAAVHAGARPGWVLLPRGAVPAMW